MKKLSCYWLILISMLLTSIVKAENLPFEIVKKITVPDTLSFIGTVEAVNSGTASAQTNGQVVQTLVDVGDLVNKDDVILKLRDTQQRANYDSAVAGVKAAQAKYDSSEKEYIRITNILKKGLVSQSAADNALSQRDSSKAALDAAQAGLKNAVEQLEYTKVKAPYSGIVLERHVEVGETVSPGLPLYTGMSLEFLRVLVDVPQKDIDKIRQNKSASIELPTGESITIFGDKLTFFGYANPKTSTFKIRVNLPTGLSGLYPGMYLHSSFIVGKKTAIVIAKKSLIHRGEVTAVYVQNDKGLSFRQIRVGRQVDEENIEILSGLTEGETVITSPTSAIIFLQSAIDKD